MPIELIVQNTPYEYPVPGDEPGWGQPATDWAAAVTDVLNDLLGPNDIAQTSVTILNNATAFQDIVGLQFNTGSVRAASINYAIYRVSTANPSGHAETGLINVVYDNAASAGSKWLIAAGPIVGNSGVTFSMTDTGQVQYKSTDINATGYVGKINFRAKTLGQ